MSEAALQCACLDGFSSERSREAAADAGQTVVLAEMADRQCITNQHWSFIGRSSRLTRRAPPRKIGDELQVVAALQSGCEIRARAPCSSPPASPARPEVIMRKLATAVAVAFAALSAQAALACDEKVERAEQPQHKPAVAQRAQKQNKQQQKAKKADTSEKTTVARADK